MNRVLFFVLLGTVALLARAQQATISLVAPTTPVVPGTEIALQLIAVNPSAQAVALPWPAAVSGRLLGVLRAWPVELTGPAETALTVPSGGFVQRTLKLHVPAEALGQLVLEIDQPARVRAAIDATGVAVPSIISARRPPALVPRPVASQIERTFAEHFSVHEPIYFLYGDAAPSVKFQLSFKYRILQDNGQLVSLYPALRQLHFAYTQRSLWDIRAYSSPFYDTSYMPELIYEALAPDTGKSTGGFTWLGYHGGVQHESNGRNGDASRSLNQVYIRPAFAFGDLAGWRLIVSPKFFAYVDELTDNPDLRRYRGFCELRALFGKNDHLELACTARWGTHFEHSSVQLDLTYPVRISLGDFATYLHAQYFDGYGESLLSYNRRSSMLRAGFSLVR
ncbi:MAG: phospholipase A [Opitutae bacterium]|nr:phospholipase A [Opitutae bacterium]